MANPRTAIQPTAGFLEPASGLFESSAIEWDPSQPWRALKLGRDGANFYVAKDEPMYNRLRTTRKGETERAVFSVDEIMKIMDSPAPGPALRDALMVKLAFGHSTVESITPR